MFNKPTSDLVVQTNQAKSVMLTRYYATFSLIRLHNQKSNRTDRNIKEKETPASYNRLVSQLVYT
jgi:hypothetical protein